MEGRLPSGLQEDCETCHCWVATSLRPALMSDGPTCCNLRMTK